MTTHQATMLLFGMTVILVLARVCGAAARRLGQPAVIGEIAAGVLAGPTLLHGAVSSAIFPTDVRPFLTTLANIGVALFMFVVGLELDHGLVRGRGRVAATVSLGSILLPFAGGALLALHLKGHHPTGETLPFVLFIGTAMAITAFPVLARILTDRGMQRTPVGTLALACAAVDDVLAWSLLAVVVAISGDAAGHPWQLTLLLPYLVLMIGVVRPLLRRLPRELTVGTLSTVLIGLLLSAAATEWIGLHFIFGAFLFGALLPRTPGSRVRQDLIDRLGQLTGVLFLPIFFVVAGLQVDLSAVGAGGLLDLALILLVAVGGKFLGAFGSARLHRVPARDAAALAALVNARGLTELVVLSVGLGIGVLDTGTYSLMVVMAFVTTAMAGPLLSLFRAPRNPAEEPAALLVAQGGQP